MASYLETSVEIAREAGALLSEYLERRIDMMTNDRSYSGNALLDVSYIGSTNGGTTWTVRRVTNTSWDPSKYGVPSGSGFRPFLGDYDGIVSTPTPVGMTWTGPGRTFGALPTNLEVYFASVTP